MKLLLVIAIIVCIFCTTTCGITNFQVHRDVTSHLGRAQIAADEEGMLEGVNKTIAALEERGWTKGHTAFWFTAPSNDIGIYYEALLSVRQRVEEISAFDHATPQYQSGMDDCRGIIRELYDGNIGAIELAWRFRGTMLLMIFALFSGLVGFVGFTWITAN